MTRNKVLFATLSAAAFTLCGPGAYGLRGLQIAIL
jgi:hypothetical protein